MSPDKKKSEQELQEKKVLEMEQIRLRRRQRAKIRNGISLGVLVLLVILAFQIENFGKAINFSHFVKEMFSAGNGYPLSLAGEELKRFTEFRGDPAILTKSGFSVYSESARQVISLQHSFTNPAVDTTYNKIMLYDRQGKSLCVYEDDHLMYEKKIDHALLSGMVAGDGRSAISSTATGYDSKVVLYSITGAELFSWSSLDTYVMYMDFDGDEKGMVTAGVSASSGRIQTTLSHLRFDKEEVLWKVTLPDEVPMHMEYLNNGTICLVTDTSIHFYSSAGEEVGTYLFDGRTLAGIYTKDINQPVVLLKAYDGATSANVVTVNQDGKAVASFNSPATVRDISVYGGKIYMLTARGLARYTQDGTEDTWEQDQSVDGRQFQICAGRGYVYASDHLVQIGL